MIKPPQPVQRSELYRGQDLGWARLGGLLPRCFAIAHGNEHTFLSILRSSLSIPNSPSSSPSSIQFFLGGLSIGKSFYDFQSFNGSRVCHQGLNLSGAPYGIQSSISIHLRYATKRPQSVIKPIANKDAQQGNGPFVFETDVTVPHRIFRSKRKTLEVSDNLVVALQTCAGLPKSGQGGSETI